VTNVIFGFVIEVGESGGNVHIVETYAAEEGLAQFEADAAHNIMVEVRFLARSDLYDCGVKSAG